MGKSDIVKTAKTWAEVLASKSEGQLKGLKKHWDTAIQANSERARNGKPNPGDSFLEDERYKAILNEIGSRKGSRAGLVGAQGEQPPPQNLKLEYLAKKGILGMDPFDAAHSQPEKLREMFPSAYQQIAPEEENTLAKTPRNSLVDFLGLPEGMKETQADVKRWENDFAENAGSGSAGAIKKVSAAGIKAASQKLTPELAAKLQGLVDNPKGLIETDGAVNSGIQTLRDLLGQTGGLKINAKSK